MGWRRLKDVAMAGSRDPCSIRTTAAAVEVGGGGQPLPAVTYVTTVWANHGGTWHAVFHQESTAAKR